MPIQKIVELMKHVSSSDNNNEVSDLLLTLHNSKDNYDKISESLIMMFSIMDTNHKQNKKIILETLSVLLIIVQKMDTLHPKQSANPQTVANSNKAKSTKTSTKSSSSKFSDAVSEAIKQSPALFIIVSSIFIMTILYFLLFKMDGKAAEKTIDSVAKVTKLSTKESK